MSGTPYSYGSISVDDIGIRKRSRLLIGTEFKMTWDELVSWCVADAFVTTLDTGQTESMCRLLELHDAVGVHQIDKNAAGDKLDALVAYLRLRCPEKESAATPQAHAE